MTSKPNYPEAVERVDIEGLRALLAAIPAGMRPRWEVHEDTTSGVYEIRTCLDGDVDGDTGQHLVIGGEPVAFMADALGEYDLAALIVAAVNGLATLLNAKEAAEGEMERLRGAVINLSDALAVSDDRLDVAEAKLSTLEKALEWYGDAANYIPDGKHWTTNTDLDKGDRARQALSNLPKSGGVLEVAAADNNRLALAEIAAERRRQVEVEGWTPGHDDEHDKGEMAKAAACYAASHNRLSVPGPFKGPKHDGFHRIWPWAACWWKPSDPRRNLVKAGALIIAEIERLDRQALIPPAPAADNNRGAE